MSDECNDVDCSDNPGTNEAWPVMVTDALDFVRKYSASPGGLPKQHRGDEYKRFCAAYSGVHGMVEKRDDLDCPNRPPDCPVFHCYALDCPVHGNRNAGELIRARDARSVLEDIEAAVRPNSWKLGCKTRGDSGWAYNALRFPSREACLKYGMDLVHRWAAPYIMEAHPSDDVPNMPE